MASSTQSQIDIVVLIVVCGATVLWALFLAFWLARLITLIVVYLTRKYLGKDARIWFDVTSLGLCPFTGTVSFRNLRIVGPGVIVQAAQGSARFRYWETGGRTRLVLSITGLRVTVFNNKNMYSSAPEVLEQELPLSASPKWTRVLLPIKFELIGVSVVFASPTLPATTAIVFERAQLKLIKTGASGPKDLYAMKLDGDVNKLKVQGPRCRAHMQMKVYENKWFAEDGPDNVLHLKAAKGKRRV